MALPDATKILRVPGQLCINPTNLGIAFPHGGTAIGVASQMRILTGLEESRVTAEEFGGQAVEAVLGKRDFFISALLRQWDNDALAMLFGSDASAGASGDKVINWPGTDRGGYKLSSRSVKLCFTADRFTEQPSVLIYKAIPLYAEQEALRLTVLRELAMPVVFLGVRDGSSRVASMGLLSDLSL